MEADGMFFYDFDLNKVDIFLLMKKIGITAVRLRVWVNPDNKYGPFNNKNDVIQKAKRAKAAGLKIMIDFHYSDYFADPGKQTKPEDWAGLDFNGVKEAISEHTKDILKALKKEGITVIWVQVGNETSGGMVYDDGRILWNTDDLDISWRRYAELSNAGYYAVKEVFPNAIVIVHHDNGHLDNTYFYQTFSTSGGKFDMIGLSYYPDWSQWESMNTIAAERVQNLSVLFNTSVMVVETGFSTWDATKAEGVEQTGDSHYAEQVFIDLFKKMKQQSGCRGIFYWEPEVYGGFSHYINEEGVNIKENGNYGNYVTNHGAFNKYGQPSIQLQVFGKS